MANQELLENAAKSANARELKEARLKAMQTLLRDEITAKEKCEHILKGIAERKVTVAKSTDFTQLCNIGRY